MPLPPASARAYGAEIRLNAPVSQVLIEAGEAVGVVLAGGEEIRAKIVASNLDPKVTFLKLIAERDLPGEFVRLVGIGLSVFQRPKIGLMGIVGRSVGPIGIAFLRVIFIHGCIAIPATKAALRIQCDL